MKKELKIALYCILVVVVIAVIYLMFWLPRQDVENPEIPGEIVMTWEDEPVIPENEDTKTATFEEDVMKDLEWFFGDSNGYEDVQWEFWFTNPENE